jgi:16S rRNA (adenine1518-N6/adenine1519-N6)-dimethyltransferase
LDQILEIGPGTGVLTGFLRDKYGKRLHLIEVDGRSVDYLRQHFPLMDDRIHHADFLRFDPEQFGFTRFAVIGNFPYNISSQILFRVLDFYEKVPVLAGMFQKEVAERIASGPGSRDYGILSVLLQAHYNIEYLFTVPAHVFTPPPKVLSGVIRMTLKKDHILTCNPSKFKAVIKMAFNQRRKVMRNSLSQIAAGQTNFPYATLRPEQLSWEQFVELVLWFEKEGKI